MIIKEGCQTMYHHLILSCDACDINAMKELWGFGCFDFFFILGFCLFFVFVFSWRNSSIL